MKLFTVLVGEAAVSELHPAHEHFAERYREMVVECARRIERSIESGDVAASADRELVARLIIATMDGLQIQWLLDEEFDMTAAFEGFLSLLRSEAGTS